MKTTKITVIAKKLQKLITAKQLNKNSLVYSWVSNMKTDDVFRPVFSQGKTWKFSSLTDKTKELTDLLDKLGVAYEIGNDAPKGGKTGVFVKIKTIIKS